MIARVQGVIVTEQSYNRCVGWLLGGGGGNLHRYSRGQTFSVELNWVKMLTSMSPQTVAVKAASTLVKKHEFYLIGDGFVNTRSASAPWDAFRQRPK